MSADQGPAKSQQVRCVGANLYLSPKPEDNVVQFRFTCVSAPLGHEGDQWFESAFVLYTNKPTAYEVGKLYTFSVEIK